MFSVFLVSFAEIFFSMAVITNRREFKDLDVLKHRHLVEIRLYPKEGELYLTKIAGLLGDFGELSAAWYEGY